MKKLSIGILAHVDSGKTTLSEALMYCSGNINKLGRVDHKNSFLDNLELERNRGITIFSKQAVMKYRNNEITLLDTPGHVDFSCETERVLQILDYAVLVVSGTDGVQSHTCTLWRLLKRYNVPTFIFVNKMDMDGAYKEKIISELKSRLSESCIEFEAENTGSDFYEEAAICDEALLEQYYDSGKLDIKSIAHAVKERKIFPCLFGSALKLEGVTDLLDTICKYSEMPVYKKNFGAKVFKISEDKQGNRLTFIKITGGRLNVKDIIASPENINSEKVNQIRIYSGEKYIAADTAKAGTVCAVTGITFAHSGDGLGEEQNSFLPLLEPVLTYSVKPLSDTDPHTAFKKLKILEEEDPQLNVVWNNRLSEIQINVMGEIQLEILKSIIPQRFGFDVEFGSGSIVYKETISNRAEGVGHFEPLRHYAEVHLILEPAKRGSGISITSVCKEDNLDKNWQRLIISQLSEKTHIGVLTGSPLTDVNIVLTAGKAHLKHTEGGDFRQAAYRAVRQGLMQAESVLLEPVYDFMLEVPVENTGRAMSDIQRMYGKFDNPQNNGEASVLTGTAPAVCISGYIKEVNKYTHGKGKLVLSLKGYEPCHNSDEVIKNIGYVCESDTENPADSVFCSHGAGYNVKWNEVPKHMHLPSSLNDEKDNTENESKTIRSERSSRASFDIFADDKELMAIFEKTYGSVKKDKRKAFGSAKDEIKKERTASGDVYKIKNKKSFSGKEYLLVDGYNIIFSWDSLKKIAAESLDTARNTLINVLCNYQGYRKCEVILVFDAYKVKGQHREIEKINNISVVYTKEAETADMYIEKVTHSIAKDNNVRVVTSDGMEQLIIMGNGALRVSSNLFRDEVIQVEQEIRSIIEKNNIT